MGNLRLLGLAAVALLATGVAAPSAQAAEFTAAAAGVNVTGNQVEKITFLTEAGSIKCANVAFAGSTPAAAYAEQTLSATYSNCTLSGFSVVDVSMGSCDYRFHAAGTVDIACPAGSRITTTVTNEFGATRCTITVGAQNGVSGVTYKNLAGGKLEIDFNVFGLTYTLHGTGCGGVEGQHNFGNYLGTATLTPGNGALSIDTP